MTTKTQYEEDYAGWADENARLLRSGQHADTEHIAEELEALSRREHQSLKHCLVTIVEHKLKLRLTFGETLERNRRKWRRTVIVRQQKVRDLLDDSPSLHGDLTPEFRFLVYHDALLRFKSAEFMQAYPAPEKCPFDWHSIQFRYDD